MKCQTEGCENEARTHRRICSTCDKRKYRQKYPIKYWYDTLKMNAKRRRKYFDLTLEQFKEFCLKTGYNEKKGKTAESLSIDRKENSEGYTKGNIRAITLSDNVRRNFDPSLIPEETCPF